MRGPFESGAMFALEVASENDLQPEILLAQSERPDGTEAGGLHFGSQE
jgi:hypothetical protein